MFRCVGRVTIGAVLVFPCASVITLQRTEVARAGGFAAQQNTSAMHIVRRQADGVSAPSSLVVVAQAREPNAAKGATAAGGSELPARDASQTPRLEAKMKAVIERIRRQFAAERDRRRECRQEAKTLRLAGRKTRQFLTACLAK